MVTKHKIQLSRHYTYDDDPDEMESEYKLLKNKRDKVNQVNFYKKILLTIVCGVEFLNEKYDPFDFKLTDWSKQMAAEQDDYTEVLEELYDKYKDRGGKMSPEVRLLFMIIFSAVTFHLTNSIFGKEGIKSAVDRNPNIIQQIFKTFVGGQNQKNELGSTQSGPSAQSTQAPPNNRAVLDLIKHNKQQNQNMNTDTDVNPPSPHSGTPTLSQKELEVEKERKSLLEQRRKLDAEFKQREDMQKIQLDKMKQHEEQLIRQLHHDRQRNQQLNQQLNQTVNQLNEVKSHTVQTTAATTTQLSEELDLFESRSDGSADHKSATGQTKADNLNTLLESLDESLDITDILETASKKSNPKRKYSPRNDYTQSVKKSRAKTESLSDGLSTATRKNKATVIKL